MNQLTSIFDRRASKHFYSDSTTLTLLLTMISLASIITIASGNAEAARRKSKKAKQPSAATKTTQTDSEPVKAVTPDTINAEDKSKTKADKADESTVNSAPAKPQPSPSEWEYSVAPYFFLARLDGTFGARGRTAQGNASFTDIFRNLDFALMGTFEAKKGKFIFLGDAMYMKLSGKKVTPSPLFSDIEVETKELVIDPEVGYRVVDEKGGSIDLLGGVRFWHVKNHITFQPRILPLVDVEESKNWADPVIGVRGTAHLSPRTFVVGKFDMGGFGLASDFTGQAFGGVGFKVKPKLALIGGYRYLRVDYVKDDFVFKTAMSGIMLGAKFRL